MNKTSLKIATALLSVIFVLSVFPNVRVNAATSGTCGDNLTWTLDDIGILTISGSGEINTSAFESRSDIKNVVIENGVTSIGDRAFYGCQDISIILIPDSVTLIGDNAFCFCSLMRDIKIPESVTSIGDNAFSYTALTYVDIPKSVTSIGEGAFDCCYDLKSVNISEGVTLIEDNTFHGCYYLTSVTIPNSVTSIGDGAFLGCHSLTSVTIPNSVTSIGDGAFSGCYNLTSVTIPDSVTSIGEIAFSGCSSLTSVTIPDSVTSIGESAFSVCSSLTSVDIPNSVTSIGTETFYGCSSLTSITIPNSVTSIKNTAFAYSGLTSITIPNRVTEIGDSAFSGCSSLTSITIPNSVTEIGEGAFSGCSSLTSVDIPNSVTSIGTETFYMCSSLASITIPDSVTSIGDAAFYECKSFTSVVIPSSVTLINDSAFYGCSNLESVEIDKALYDKLDADVFGNCPKFDESKCVFRYKVTFVNDDGTELYSNSLKYGATPSYPYSNPEKQADAQYTYAFSGWSYGSKTYGLNDELPEVTGDVTYTAQYKSTPNKYTVTFIDYDDTVISSAEYDYDTKAEDIKVPTPSRAADAQYTYTFTGWDKEIADVTVDVTYTAQYSSTVNKYTVKFVDEEGNVLQTGEVAYGTAPGFTGTPSKAETDTATYAFAGWTDGTTTYGAADNLPTVTGAVTYKAVFTETLKPIEAETTIVKPVETPVEVAQPAENVPAPITYTIGEVKGDGINSDIVIDVHRSEDDANCISYFRSVANNGVAMKNGEQYTAVTGSTIITIKSDYIKTLPAGEYTITVNFKDGSISTTITIPERSGTSVPSTGESIGPAVYVGVALILVSCAATGFILTKKRREEA